jgi:transcriptional regulator with XRE-family HTH domain
VAAFIAATGTRQADVAKAIGLEEASVSRSIRGLRKWQLEELDRIASFFGVPMPTLFESPDQLQALARNLPSGDELPGQVVTRR